MLQDDVSIKIKILNYKVQEQRLEKAWRRFENAGFKPLLIKGWAAAQVYPQASERIFNDIDLMIEPTLYREALKFLGETDKTGIDLHNGAKTLDNVSFTKLYARSQVLQCGATRIRIPCAEDHLRILCVHWLTDGGAKREKLWDVFYAVKNRPADFDWERCLEAAGKTRKKWVVCTIALAVKYLGLPLADTPIAVQGSEIPGWVIDTIEKEWASGVPLIPLRYCLHERKKLWQQVCKRLPPNPIQATVDMEGEFDDRSRFFYQLGDVFLRLKPSLIKIFGNFFANNQTDDF